MIYMLTIFPPLASTNCSAHVLDEAERSLHDALCVLTQTVEDSRVLLGGGWPEMVMGKEVDALARKTPGKRSHAIDAFSRALQAIPTIIADNAGLDSAELVSQLRAEHHKESSNAGIDVITGGVSFVYFNFWVVAWWPASNLVRSIRLAFIWYLKNLSKDKIPKGPFSI